MDWIVGWLSVLQAVQALGAPQWIWAGTAGILPHTRGFANTITAWGTCWHELSGAQSLLWLRAWQAPVPSMRLLMYQVTIVTQVLKSKTPLESWGSFDVETREAKAFATKLGTFPGRKKEMFHLTIYQRSQYYKHLKSLQRFVETVWSENLLYICPMKNILWVPFPLEVWVRLGKKVTIRFRLIFHMGESHHTKASASLLDVLVSLLAFLQEAESLLCLQ